LAFGAKALVNAVDTFINSLRFSLAADAAIEPASPTAFPSYASGQRDRRPSAYIAVTAMAAFPIASSTEPAHFCRY
jgi:hypothetical protein